MHKVFAPLSLARVELPKWQEGIIACKHRGWGAVIVNKGAEKERFMGNIGKIEQVEIDKLVPYERNAKIHNEFQIQKIADSIQEFGFLNPCLIDKDYNVIAGHGRIEGAKKLGMDKVPCLFVEGLTDAQRRAYILADNKLGELADWDMTMVNLELNDLSMEGFDVELTGFDTSEIAKDLSFDDDAEDGGNEIEKKLLKCPVCGHVNEEKAFKYYEDSQ